MAESAPIKLLLVSPLPPPPGGIATWTRILLDELALRQDVDDSHINTALRWRPIVSRSLLLRVMGGSCQAFVDGLRVLKRLVTRRPDVMHVTTSARLGLARDLLFLIAARLLGVHSVLHIHDPRIGQITSDQEWQLRLSLFAIGFADCVIVLDQESLDVLSVRLADTRVVRVPNMVSLVEIDRVLGEPSRSLSDDQGDDFELVFVGRVTQQKGVEELVEACVSLEHVNLHCLGPIDQQCRQRIENFARRRNDGRWLELHGHVSREAVLRQILQSDLFVLPSHSEAFPLSILESMALSKPIVATNVGAVKEIIASDERHACGVCIEVGRAEDLRETILQLQQSSEVRADLGSHGRQNVERLYSTTQVMRQLLALWGP